MNDRREETTLENKPLDNKSEINNNVNFHGGSNR